MIENMSKLWQGLWRTQPSETPTNPTNLSERVRAAYSLLCDANRRAIQVPADVVSVITEARRIDSADWTADFEAKFWNAYGLLSSSIHPAARARMLYKTIFYFALLFLLLFQLFNLAGDHLRSALIDLDKQLIDVRGKSAPESKTLQNAVSPAAANEQIAQILQEKQDYLNLSGSLLTAAGTIFDFPLRPFGVHGFFAVSDSTKQEPDSTIVRGKLNLLLVFLSSYLLPMLYGLLGACAFVLRKLSDEIDKLTYAHDAQVRYSLRLNIGILSGLVVGWFIKPTPGDTALASLSPLALAFIAGYGSDLFFAALDRIVQAFAPSGAASSRTTTEITAGGVTQVRSRIDETRVAGDIRGDVSL